MAAMKGIFNQEVPEGEAIDEEQIEKKVFEYLNNIYFRG